MYMLSGIQRTEGFYPGRQKHHVNRDWKYDVSNKNIYQNFQKTQDEDKAVEEAFEVQERG